MPKTITALGAPLIECPHLPPDRDIYWVQPDWACMVCQAEARVAQHAVHEAFHATR